MASKPRKRKPARKAAPMTRAMLLPMPAALAQTVSLKKHMALVALRQGHGNIDLAGELLRTIYLTYFLADGEAQTTSQDLFASAECAIKTTIAQSVMTGEWCLEDSHTR